MEQEQANMQEPLEQQTENPQLDTPQADVPPESSVVLVPPDSAEKETEKKQSCRSF